MRLGRTARIQRRTDVVNRLLTKAKVLASEDPPRKLHADEQRALDSTQRNLIRGLVKS
jgi:hypothetical protein